jgi:hypothetical protein
LNFQVFDDMPHVLVLFGSLCSSAKYAYRSIASFVKAVTSDKENAADATPVSDTGFQLPLEEHGIGTKELEEAVDAARADNPERLAHSTRVADEAHPDIERGSTGKYAKVADAFKRQGRKKVPSKNETLAFHAYQSTQPFNVRFSSLTLSSPATIL